MSPTLAQLLAVGSLYAEDIDAFCEEAIKRLDSTGFFYKGNAGDPAVISISRTGVDARVFTRNPKPDDTDRLFRDSQSRACTSFARSSDIDQCTAQKG